MDYITVREAAAKWGVTERTVQLLCKNGKVDGAVRFNGAYAIPKDAQKPKDRRRREETGETTHMAAPKMDSAFFKEVFDCFPYRINITAEDGTLVYANRVFTEGMLEGFGESLMGQYNIRTEENLEKWALKAHVEKAFSGQPVFTPNVEFPNRTMVGKSYRNEYAFISLYEDVTSFPMFDREGNLKYVVTVFFPARRIIERREVQLGREYIESHWQEPFDTALAAKAANLSVSQFARMFREDSGFSPHDYYMEVKFDHIQEKLLDSNLTVAQAFAACGVDYNNHYVMLFKNHTGMTPTQYIKTHNKAW